VNGPRHQLFTGAALAGDEHRGVGRSDSFNGIEDVLHGCALSNDVGRMGNRRHCLLKARVLLLGAAMDMALAIKWAISSGSSGLLT